MKRNSTTLFLKSPSATTPIPWVNGAPDFSGITEPTLSVLQAAYESGKDNITVIPDPIPEPPVITPDWDGLLNRLLSGDLYSLFQAITLAAFSNPLVLIARNDIYGAISNPKISDRISALRAGLDMLLQSGYQISDSDCIIWNTAMAELNFPDEVKL